VTDADLVELRLDTVRDPSAVGALAGRHRPVIVTCRPQWEGGHFAGSEEERRRILAEALNEGAEYVDLEWRARFDDLFASAERVVLSAHHFDGAPFDLAAQAQAMRSSGAAVVKIAVNVKRLSDCVPLLELGAQAGSANRFVLIGMGQHGMPTRILASRFGSAWTYAGAIRDVGQLSADALLNEYRFRSISDSTDIYGIVAGAVAHSVSPAMHNAAFRETRTDAVYVPFAAVDADDFVTFARAIGARGASITIPHKVTLFDRVDEIDPVARRIGAINTIRVENGRWIGGNTDAEGFLQPLRGRVPLKGLRASVLGGGGAARAVVVALTSAGSIVRLHARNRGQAEQVARLCSCEVGAWPPEPGSWDLLVNTTPIGMYPRVDETPIPRAQLTGRHVYDLVYNPPVTRLLREAAEAGCQTTGGLDMLVAQAHEQFRWWTGIQPPNGVMREAALKRLAEFARDEDYVV
jgi:3-dehydroquinate dehydratase/shikimate dehydrogenase